MAFNIIRYFRDRHIDYSTEGSKCTKGWVNTYCPFCHSQDKHLGFNLAKSYFHCWHGCRIGSVENYIMKIEGVDYNEACKIYMEYDDDFIYRPSLGQDTIKKVNKLEWPRGTVNLQSYHKTYLAQRNHDPDYLAQKYQLMGTLPAGPYALRIMAPIFYQGQWVSYQGRDITGKTPLKYKACKKELEIIHHKNILYNLDNCKRKEIIVVEGLFDVWRLGDDTCATFGTSVSKKQINVLSKFKRVFIMFDSEQLAQKKAKELADQLSLLGVESINISLSEGDPGDMATDDANKLKSELLGKKIK